MEYSHISEVATMPKLSFYRKMKRKWFWFKLKYLTKGSTVIEAYKVMGSRAEFKESLLKAGFKNEF